MKEQRVIRFVWLAIVLLILALGWPTQWRYGEHQGRWVRVHRLTGKQETFSPRIIIVDEGHTRADTFPASWRPLDTMVLAPTKAVLEKRYKLDTLP